MMEATHIYPSSQPQPFSAAARSGRLSREVALEVRGLQKSYGATPAVAGINFEVQAGEIFGLLGPNGAGKTTTIAVIDTSRRASAGDVILFGHSVSDEPDVIRRMIGLVPQDVALYPMLTAAENLAFFGRLYDLAGAEL